MITTSQIRDLVGNTIYTQAKRLYNTCAIKDFHIEETSPCDYLDATIEDNDNTTYIIQIAYNKDYDDLEELDCDCEAFYQYPGICKHCAAALFEYQAYIDRQAVTPQIIERQNASLNQLKSLKGAYTKKPALPIETTAAIKQVLAKRQTERILPITQKDTYGKVTLNPHLIYVTAGLIMEFHIGITQTYVVKDLFAFVHRMENREHYSYGKKLEFIHSIEMFEPDSQPVVNYIMDWARQNRDRYIQLSSYGAYSIPKTREIQLNGAMLEEFLDAIGSRTISVGIPGQDAVIWQVVLEPLKRKIEIVGAENGIEVTLDDYPVVVGNKYHIIFANGAIHRIPRTETSAIADFLLAMTEVKGHTAYIQDADIPVFCHEILPELKKACDCRITNFNADDYGITPPSFKIYLDSPQANFITFKAVAVYGEQQYNIFGKIEDAEKRDLIQEEKVKQIVLPYGNTYDQMGGRLFLANDDDLLYDLLTEGIMKMQEVGEVYISDALKQVNISRTAKISVGVTLAGNMLELKMTAGDMPKEQLLEILSKYDRKKKYYRLKDGSFVDMQEEGIQALLEMQKGLCLTDKQMKQETVTLPKYRALYLDSELKEYQALPAVKDKSFKVLVRNMKTIEDNDFEIPAAMDKVLREYQKRGFLWLKTLKHNGFGGILADDMGLGKTLQVIALLQSEYLEAKDGKENRTLIVSPASLVFNWNSEIQRFAPNLPVKMVVGTAKERQMIIQNAGEYDILLTSYDLLKRDLVNYQSIHFANQIIDEAQYIKNHNTQAAKAVKEIQAGFKLALTGTPVENSLGELWSIFDYLMPGFLYSYQRFRKEMEQPIVHDRDEKALERLRKMVRPFILRRLKKDVLTDLPDKMEKNYFARLEGEQQKLYDAHVKRLQLLLNKQSDEEFKHSRIQILAELTKLRQICCNPGLVFEDYTAVSVKTELCLELIQNAAAGGHKILLFSQFTSMLEELKVRMQKAQISFYTLTGATGKAKRAKLVEDFNKDDTQVFCISLKAGGTGLNLTAADIVIHYDPWWNQAVQNQATDRAHRIGQKNVVTVYKLIAKDTIEENILKLQEKKSELADQILGGGELSGGSFTKEELIELLR